MLLTESAPEAKYASAEVLRRILRHVPGDRIRWAYLGGAGPAASADGKVRGFSPRRLHWRLRAGMWQYLLTRAQARPLARAIARWAADFGPEVLWVYPGMSCVPVAERLGRLLSVPLHVTVHDAYELDREFARPAGLYGIYLRDVAALLRRTVSLDAVSRELLDHVEAGFGLRLAGSLVFPPSMDRAGLARERREPGWDSDVRKVGVCGNPRVERPQWEAFMGVLSRLPFRFEIHAFGNVEMMAGTPCPANVRLVSLGYAPSEEDVVEYLETQDMGVCYLGLYREPARAFFARTSLSSKLTTYAAAGRPVCVDGPEDSVAGRLVAKYGAGVRVAAPTGGVGDLLELLSDKDVWRRRSEGARRLCAAEMDLPANALKFAEVLTLAAQTGARSVGRAPRVGPTCSPDRDGLR